MKRSAIHPLAAPLPGVLSGPMDHTDKSRRIMSVSPGVSTPRRSAAAPITPRSSGRTPTRTPPPPDDRFVGWDAGPDPTTAICEYEVEGDWELHRDTAEFSIGGSSKCTISIPGRGLSARHCLLERRADKLRLHDLDSSHGTFVRARKLEGSADLSPGDTFTARPMTFVCLNDEMRQHRPTLFEVVGSGAPRSPDWVMVQAATGSGPLLFTGEAGCDLVRLARAVHAISMRRSRPAVEVATVAQERAAQVALVRRASKTSLILPLGDEKTPLDPHFASMLFDASLGVRLVVLASSLGVARGALSDARVELMQHVPVRPIAYRSAEIEKLLDRWFGERAFPLRFAELTPANQAALRTYHWPGNFDELRAVADALMAHVTRGGLRSAAQSLGISHPMLQRRFGRVGLKLPFFCRDA